MGNVCFDHLMECHCVAAIRDKGPGRGDHVNINLQMSDLKFHIESCIIVCILRKVYKISHAFHSTVCFIRGFI